MRREGFSVSVGAGTGVGSAAAATGEVNTHKGAIFTFGIFCAGAGRCLKEQRELTALGLLEMEQEMTVRVLTAELEKLRGKISAAGQATHGERNLHRYGTAGWRRRSSFWS